MRLTMSLGDAVPFLRQKVQKRPVRDHGNVRIVTPAHGNVSQRKPGFSRPHGQATEHGLKVAPLALEVPPLADPTQVDLVAKLGGQLLHRRPRVGRRIRHLLQRVQGDDGVQLVGTKGLDAGVQRAPHARGHQSPELVVVREGGAQVRALLVAEGRQVRVRQLFVFDRQVVVALGVADEMDCGRHVRMREYGAFDGFYKNEGSMLKKSKKKTGPDIYVRNI